MKAILKIKENHLETSGKYWIWWNDSFLLNQETIVLVCHDGRYSLSSKVNDSKLKAVLNLDEVFEKNNLNIFVIAIDSNEDAKRMQLLAPCLPHQSILEKDAAFQNVNLQQIEAEGTKYLDMVYEIIDETLQEYKLNNNRKMMFGVSMGGYISAYAATLEKFKDFEKFFCLSTASWFNEPFLLENIKDIKAKNFFISVGDNENPNEPMRKYLDNAENLCHTLESNNQVSYYFLKDGEHTWLSWRKIIELNIEQLK